MRRKRTFATLMTVGCALALRVSPLAAQVCPDNSHNEFRGPINFYMNVHNCGLDCARQELPYLELFREGITGVRIAPVPRDNTQPGQPEHFDLNPFDPYFAGVLEIFGPDKVIALIDDGVDQGSHAKPRPEDMLRKLGSLLTLYPEIRHVEFMNEPLNFSGISPAEYVGRYLRPARKLIDDANAQRPADQQIKLYSAPWFGNQSGVRSAQRMVRAGALAYVDVLSAHIYGPRVEDARQLAREYKRLARGKPIAVTETNFLRNQASAYDSQEWWICQSMIAMEALLRDGLDAEEARLQRNVYYTLRADELRSFNVIGFENKTSLFWEPTGPAHFLIQERSAVITDPKPGAPGGDAGNDPGSDSDPGINPPADPPPLPPGTGKGPGRDRD